MADPDSTTSLVAVVYSMAVADYVWWSVFALTLYEYLITFGAEVELFWRPKEVTGASILFFLNRYVVFFYHLSLLRLWGSFNESLRAYVYALRSMELLCYVPWGAFSALRVFALTQRNWFLAVTVFLLSVAPIGINFADFHWMTTVVDPLTGCTTIHSESATLWIRCTISKSLRNLQAVADPVTVVMISRISLIAADLIAITATWFATYKTATMAHAAFDRKRTSFSFLLLRDGMIYFILMLTMNVLHLAFSTSAVLLTAGNGRVSEIIEFIEPLNAILVWRFMLNLQETRRRTGGSTGVSGSRNISSVHFDQIVGSIGESLYMPSILEGDSEGWEEAS